jgi:hypothetical protein
MNGYTIGVRQLCAKIVECMNLYYSCFVDSVFWLNILLMTVHMNIRLSSLLKDRSDDSCNIRVQLVYEF